MTRSQPPTLRKLAPIRLFEQASEQIRKLIASNDFPRGEKLPNEMELSKQLQVSRSSVREALRILEAEGLVEAKPGLGTYVLDTPNKRYGEMARWLEQREETLEQVLQIRESMEGLSASLAATSATSEALEEIHSLADAISQKINELDIKDEAAIDELAKLDADFHLAISQASGNKIAHEIISYIIPAFNESNKAFLYLRHRTGVLDDEHHAVVTALEGRDPEAAEKAMRNHVKRVRKEIMEIRGP